MADDALKMHFPGILVVNEDDKESTIVMTGLNGGGLSIWMKKVQ